MVNGRRAALAALSAGVFGLLALGGGTANAATYRVSYEGPFVAEDACNGRSAALNDPPDLYSSSCFYSATGVPGYKLLPGWYFRYQYRID
jgi:hypothetical protein